MHDVNCRCRPVRRLGVAAVFVLLTLAAQTGCHRAKPDVYLLLVDTLRADHLGLYGYERHTSPNLDRFAASAVVFEKVVAPAPWTLPSVGSVMTGIYPGAHGLRARTQAAGMTALRPAVSTLAEAFAGEGYRTVAVVTNPWLTSGEHGLARGFEEYVPLEMANARAVNERSKRLIDREDPRPLFLYLHYMDPHGPYNRLPRFKAAGLGPLPVGSVRELDAKERARMPDYLRLPGATNLGSYVQLYDRAIRFWDDSFGDWVAWVDARSADSPPVIAVVADHGEEFAERGGWSHGETLYEEQLSVPWLMRLPGGSPRRVVDRVVSLIDVAPTLLSVARIPVPETMMGSNVLDDGFRLDRPVYAETDVRSGGIVDPRFVQRAVRRRDEKYIARPSGPECYDLAVDRAERSSGCTTASWSRRALEDLERWTQENEALAEALGEGEVVELDREQNERLRAIGYIQ